jgi:hypothetical protein
MGQGSSGRISYPATVGALYSLTTYSDSGCATIVDGPEYNVAGVCNQETTTTSNQFNVAGGLQLCSYTSSGSCSGSSTCVTIPTGSCVGAGSSYIKYYTSAAAGVVVTYATAALIAVASVVLSL